MIGAVFALLFGGMLIGTLAAAGELRRPIGKAILAGFGLRLVLQFFLRDIEFFSHGAGGDCLLYEEYGRLIAANWKQFGVHFVTSAELEVLGPTSLPANMFALLTYFNDGSPTQIGATGLVALATGLVALNVYSLAIEAGAERRIATLVATIIYFEPAVLFYTSDSYKDGLVLCFALGALGSALRLGRRFSVTHTVIGICCVWALWYVRFYLVFLTVAPLLVGLVGVQSKGIARPLLAGLALTIAFVAIGSQTEFLQTASERASQAFEMGTSRGVLESNAEGGSGVAFNDGGVPYAALPAKLLYTLFSPFPWAPGSLGFQLGKIDVILWYALIYRAIRAMRQVDFRTVMMVLTFAVPCTILYAMSMSNVGLIVRQRLVIVVAVAILAAAYKPKKASVAARRLPLRRLPFRATRRAAA